MKKSIFIALIIIVNLYFVTNAKSQEVKNRGYIIVSNNNNLKIPYYNSLDSIKGTPKGFLNKKVGDTLFFDDFFFVGNYEWLKVIKDSGYVYINAFSFEVHYNTSIHNNPYKVIFGLGYSSKKQLIVDFGYAKLYSFGGKVNINFDVVKRLNNTDESNTVGWNDYPKDVLSEGSYFNSYDFSFGYFHKYFFTSAVIGYAQKKLYRNSYDQFGIVGDYGSYSLTESGGGFLNYGCEVGINILNIENEGASLEFIYTKYTGGCLVLNILF